MNQACFSHRSRGFEYCVGKFEGKRSTVFKRSQKGGDDEKKEDVSCHFSFNRVSAVVCHDAANLNKGSTGHRPCCEVVCPCMYLRGERIEDTCYPGEN